LLNSKDSKASKATGIGLTPDQIKGILVFPLKIRVS